MKNQSSETSDETTAIARPPLPVLGYATPTYEIASGADSRKSSVAVIVVVVMLGFLTLLMSAISIGLLIAVTAVFGDFARSPSWGAGVGGAFLLVVALLAGCAACIGVRGIRAEFRPRRRWGVGPFSVTPTREAAWAIAARWAEDWNSHNLNRILSHYTDDFEMSSPFISRFVDEPSGTLKGKKQVAAYWKAALERIPDLHFTVLEVFAGAGSIAIHFEAMPGSKAVEVLFLNENGTAYRAVAHYDRT